MSGLLDLYAQPTRRVTNPLPTAPKDSVERFELEWAASRAPDRFGYYQSRLSELYGQVIDRAEQVTGQRFDNPMDFPEATPEEVEARQRIARDYWGVEWDSPATNRAKKHKELVEGLSNVRRLHPEIADPNSFDAQIALEANLLRRRAAEAEGLGGSVGAFTGAVAGEMSNPVVLGVTVATLPLGGSGAAFSLGRGILAGGLKPLLGAAGRTAGVEAGISAFTEALVQNLDSEIQGRLGTDPGFEARAESVIAAGVGGAVFGGSFRALVDTFRLVRGSRRASREERDALNIFEQAILDQQTRPWLEGPEAEAAYDEAADAAFNAASAGEPPPDVIHLGPPAFRALPAPEQIAPEPVASEQPASDRAPPPDVIPLGPPARGRPAADEAAPEQSTTEQPAPDRPAAQRSDPADSRGADAQTLDKRKEGLRSGQADITMDQLYELAPSAQDNLAEAGQQIAAETGARFKNPGVKERTTSEEKLVRKGYQGAGRLTDVVRGGFLVDSVEQADQVVEQLARRYEVIDEGWEVTELGYFDRKLMVRFQSGLVGEVQMWAEPILNAKKGRGTQLYNAIRSLAPDDPKRLELKAESEAVYSAAIEELSDDFKALARGGGGQASPAAATATSSEILRPSKESSAGSIETQSGERSTQSSASSTSTAGSPSSSKNLSVIEDTSSPLHVGPQAAKRNAGTVYTPAGRRVEVGYQLVDDAALTVSHTSDLQPNPIYPKELQPRQRERAASQAQIAEIAGQLQPERLGRNSEAGSGAPIVGQDGAVESGNGRVLALRRAYDEDLPGAAQYRAWLESLGYDLTGIERPILIARRATPLTPVERAAFAREANESVTATMSRSEQAQADRSALRETLSLAAGGDLEAAANRDFVKAFLGRLPKEERAGLLTKEGTIGPDGMRRVLDAAIAAAYEDPAFVARLIESGDDGMKGIGDVLRRIALDWARLRWQVEQGLVPGGLEITADLRRAIETIDRARQAKETITDHLGQLDAFSELTPATRLLIPLFFNEDLTRQASKVRVEGRLRAFLDEAFKIDPAPNLFGEAAPTGREVLEGVVDRERQQAAGLFAEETRRHQALRDEVARAEEGELTDALEDEARTLLEEKPEATMPVDGEGNERLVREVLDEADAEIKAAETALDCAIRTAKP